MAVSKRTRYEVLRRDEFTCRYCHRIDNELTVYHVVPVALGGLDTPDNLVAACRDCNAGKSSASPDAATVTGVSADALRWAAAMTEAAAILSTRLDAKTEYVGAFLAAWPQYRSMPDSMVRTVETLYETGLPQAVMVDAAVVAGSARGVYDRPAYFAGICWKRVRAMQEIAERLVQGEGGD